MKTLSSLISASLIAAAPAAQAADEWFGADKTKHFAVSAVLGAATGMHFENKWTAFGVAMIPGLLKEISDSGQANNHFSGKDLAADALGAAIGVQFGNWLVTQRGIGYRAAF